MINVKDQVYSALSGIIDNVSDNYPRDWAQLPAIQYVEEDNSVYSAAGGVENLSHLLYRIDIWDNVSTSKMALAVDAAISKLGLRRIACRDVADPSRLKHKEMRYEGIIEVDSQLVHQNTN